jgi:hypothetical protein
MRPDGKDQYVLSGYAWSGTQISTSTLEYAKMTPPYGSTAAQ